MKKTLIVAEKPSVAQDLARVLGASKRGDGCIEGDNHTITWCFGHLAKLVEPQAYDSGWKDWVIETLPMIPPRFALQPTPSGAEHCARVCELLRDPTYEAVINACDAGREGELIFRRVYEFAGSTLPIQRLWIASLTEQAIREGMGSLKPGHMFDPLFEAARARSQADWLVGLNATRCVTIMARVANPSARIPTISVGRVQTPTLGLLVARTRERQDFTPEAFHTLKATFKTSDGATYDGFLIEEPTAVKAHRFFVKDEALLTEHAAREAATRGGRVALLERKESNKASTQFFDLTSLQQAANKRFGFSAKRTLELAQSLYEVHKVLTYPRTDSKHITPDLASTLPGRLQAAMRLPALTSLAGSLTVDTSELGKRLVNADKVTDHHAILPTSIDPTSVSMDEDETRLYELVARRLCAAISPPARVASTRVVTVVGELAFLTRGSQLLSPGWKVFEGSVEESEESKESAIPASLEQGSIVASTATKVTSDATKPPPAYTEATLLGAMERAGASLEEAELRAAMKGSGLGTPATRAETIETLLTREYITRQGKSVVATELGAQFIDALSAFPHLTDARLTGQWETMLSRVADGHIAADVFMEKVEQMTRAIVAHFKAQPPRIEGLEREQLGPCPACQTRQVLVSPKGAWCQGLRAKECDFVVGRVLAKKTLTKGQLTKLFAQGTHPGVGGFVSKAGTKFEAPLKLERRVEGEGWRIAFDFPERAKEDFSDALEVGPCPKCGGQVVLGPQSAKCTANGCDVRLWRTICGKTLEADVVGTLLTERVTPEIRGFVSKKKKRFATALVLVEDPSRGWKIGFPEREDKKKTRRRR